MGSSGSAQAREHPAKTPAPCGAPIPSLTPPRGANTIDLMVGAKTVEQFAREHLGLTLDQFRARGEGPFLVLQIPPAEATSKRSFKTIDVRPEDLKADHEARTAPPVAYVFRVEKAEGSGAGQGMITIGRTKNNDIQIDHPKISKLHAYFRVGIQGEISIIDAGSKNGTTVDGERLTKAEAHPLKGGEAVALGTEISGHYHTARTLYQALAAEKVGT